MCQSVAKVYNCTEYVICIISHMFTHYVHMRAHICLHAAQTGNFLLFDVTCSVVFLLHIKHIKHFNCYS